MEAHRLPNQDLPAEIWEKRTMKKRVSEEGLFWKKSISMSLLLLLLRLEAKSPHCLNFQTHRHRRR